MNRREFIRAALLACGGAVVGVRGAPPALEELTLEAIPLDPRQLEFQGLYGVPIVFSREALDGPDVLGPLLDEMRQNMCDALDEELISGRWPSIAGG